MGMTDLLEHARARHGVVTVTDAVAFDVSRAALYRRAAADGWLSLHPGVWLVAGARDTHEARLVAAVEVTSGLARGDTALWLHGLVDEPPHPPQILVEHARHGSRRRTDVAVRRTRHLHEQDRTTIRGFPTLVLPRSILDVAPERGFLGTRRLVIDAEREDLLDRSELVALQERLGARVPGQRMLRRVLADLGGLRSDSDLEQDIRRDLHDLGYPIHPSPFPWRCDDGVVVRLDLALPVHWVYLEVDGFGSHRKRPVFEGDRRKWTQLVRRWRPVWVTAARWRSDRAGVLADLDAAIADADPTRAAAEPAH